jgi:hypothetical protein
VNRVAGSSHQDMSESLQTLHTIMKLKDVHFFGKKFYGLLVGSLQLGS